MILHLTWTLFNDIITLLFAFAKNSAKVASSKSAATHNSMKAMPSVVSFFLSAKRFYSTILISFLFLHLITPIKLVK